MHLIPLTSWQQCTLKFVTYSAFGFHLALCTNYVPLFLCIFKWMCQSARQNNILKMNYSMHKKKKGQMKFYGTFLRSSLNEQFPLILVLCCSSISYCSDLSFSLLFANLKVYLWVLTLERRGGKKRNLKNKIDLQLFFKSLLFSPFSATMTFCLDDKRKWKERK